MKKTDTIPVIDLFAGPGGLGEGFVRSSKSNCRLNFKICLSIEKDYYAHQTLELRSFYNQFKTDKVPEEYYELLRSKLTRKQLFDRYPEAAQKAHEQSWNVTLGEIPSDEVDKRIDRALTGAKNWVLVGGPPCQAYSIVGRSRRGETNQKDPRLYLYKEFLRIIARFVPPVFVMENVKGLLSSKPGGNPIIEQIIHDLQLPAAAVRDINHNNHKKLKDTGYRLYSFVKKSPEDSLAERTFSSPEDFIIESEKYGIPQRRHRVIILGVRNDISFNHKNLLKPNGEEISVSSVLKSLPKVRSGFSKITDDKIIWESHLYEIPDQKWYKEIQNNGHAEVAAEISKILSNLRSPKYDRGKEFIRYNPKCEYLPEWFIDPRLGGVCNHSTRGHIEDDLHRYFFASSFARINDRSPELKDFPIALLPNHKSVKSALRGGNFSDRFRVQVSDKPATTITCHISKDGHYYIHPDPTQCRSLTVREAARLQTFPDNYFFCGPRTSQYTQVGNAVPVYLAKQLADVVHEIISKVRTG